MAERSAGDGQRHWLEKQHPYSIVVRLQWYASMADPEQLARIRRSVEEWNAWRAENPHIHDVCAHVPVVELGKEFPMLEAGDAATRLLEQIAASVPSA